MKRKDVKIGMRVIAVSNIEDKYTRGKEGNVVSTDYSDFWNICVEFDQNIDVWGHSRVCWCNGRHIKPVPEDGVGEITLPFAELMSV